MKNEKKCKWFRKSTNLKKSYLEGNCTHKDGKTAPKPFTRKCIGAKYCAVYEEK